MNTIIQFLDNFYILQLLEIFILSIVIFKFYQSIIKSRAAQVLFIVLLLIGIYFAADFLELYVLKWIMDITILPAVISLIILFQPELRRMLLGFGQNKLLDLVRGNKGNKSWDKVYKSLEYFSKNKIGALIAFEDKEDLSSVIESGIRLEAIISSELLDSIFDNKSPLHDGAVIIKNDKIAAAGCIFPLSRSHEISSHYGTRHRAAIGLAEELDAIVLVVSEETGKLSLAYRGKMDSFKTITELKNKLYQIIGKAQIDGQKETPFRDWLFGKAEK